MYSDNGSYYLALLDVDAAPLTVTTRFLTIAGSPHLGADITYNPFYNRYYTMSPWCGKVTLINNNPSFPSIQEVGNFNAVTGGGNVFGAAWSISTGESFFAENTSGNIYKMEFDANGIPTSLTLELVGEGASSNDGASCALATSPFVDQDGDGIPNGNDDYPADPDVAFASYTPNASSYGTYAFEDFWPKKGDYDFNDFVIGYNYEVARNASNDIAWVEMNLRLKALGAGFQSGFGISLDGVPSSAISSVTGTSTSTISLEANGTESGQTDAVIVVFDNAHQVFGTPVGRWINTGQEGSIEKDPVNITVRVEFATPVASIGTINPFIFTRGERGREIHLMDFEPTDLANQALFGTEDDVSGGGAFYKDSRGFPWAMDFPTDFRFPVEKTSIRASYTNFDTWVLNAGTTNTDWYLSENAVQESIIFVE